MSTDALNPAKMVEETYKTGFGHFEKARQLAFVKHVTGDLLLSAAGLSSNIVSAGPPDWQLQTGDYLYCFKPSHFPSFDLHQVRWR